MGDYSKFKKVETNDGLKSFRYVSDRLKSGIYDKVIIEPVDFYPSEVTSAQVTSKLLREVKAYIDKKLVDAIALSFEVVEKPQAGTMRVTPRISAIKTSTGDVEFKEMIPIGSVIALGKAAAGYRHQNIEIYMEFKATDSIDGEFIGGTVKQGKGAEISGSNEIVTLDHVKPLLEIWIEDVKDAFEKLQALRKLESQ
ncbi:DUF3313 domain-containing protein [Colwellia sp. TT2012]|uniref:DUF3313 domain-containing protein n=1 Tax=Colwellia sp. TT2012 TaxID=1720342 RepID=UPI0022B160AF|nr:DUF3313 domain-containing protein [Colwellia sp. TT2012]